MCGNMNYNQNFTTVLSIGDDIFRPLVESEAELLNHCVTIVVGEDRVVEQSIMPGSTHCSKIFLESWQILLNSKWNQVKLNEIKVFCVSILCFYEPSPAVKS